LTRSDEYLAQSILILSHSLRAQTARMVLIACSWYNIVPLNQQKGQQPTQQQ
jgi:hypothetical protein